MCVIVEDDLHTAVGTFVKGLGGFFLRLELGIYLSRSCHNHPAIFPDGHLVWPLTDTHEVTYAVREWSRANRKYRYNSDHRHYGFI